MSTEDQYERWLSELLEIMSIRSVGADPAEAQSMLDAANWLVTRLEAIGAKTRILERGRESIVLADIQAQVNPEKAQRIVIYGHYDVQPVGDPELWNSPPFQGTIKDGWLYGRGSIDTKGHLMMYLEALRAVLARGELTVNVHLLIDGAEESAGVLALDYLRESTDTFDGCIIFDGPMIAKGKPAFYGAARGMLEYHLDVVTAARDLHSGQFGGAAMNAVHVLNRIIGSVLPGENGLLRDELRVGAVPLSERDAAQLPELLTAEEVLGNEGSHPADPFVADTIYTRLWAEPSLDVNGIRAGDPSMHHMVVRREAEASVSMRLAPGQDPDTIATAFEKLLQAATPEGAVLTAERRGSSPAALLPAEGRVLDVVRDAFTGAMGIEPMTIRAGGTLPLLSVLAARGIPTVMTGMDLPEGNIHAPNERLWLEHLPLGTGILEEVLADARFIR